MIRYDRTGSDMIEKRLRGGSNRRRGEILTT